VFAVVSPGAVVPNLVAGAIAEAGAQQAGDLMQASGEAACLLLQPLTVLSLLRLRFINVAVRQTVCHSECAYA
jgi:hypothetical protein